MIGLAAGLVRRRTVTGGAGEGSAVPPDVTFVLPVMRWSGPGEVERPATVRYRRRATKLGVDADSMDHADSDVLRYITNPPGDTVRVQPADADRRGRPGLDEARVFGWGDQARESGTRMLAAIRELVAKHFPDAATVTAS